MSLRGHLRDDVWRDDQSATSFVHLYCVLCLRNQFCNFVIRISVCRVWRAIAPLRSLCEARISSWSQLWRPSTRISSCRHRSCETSVEIAKWKLSKHFFFFHKTVEKGTVIHSQLLYHVVASIIGLYACTFPDKAPTVGAWSSCYPARSLPNTHMAFPGNRDCRHIRGQQVNLSPQFSKFNGRVYTLPQQRNKPRQVYCRYVRRRDKTVCFMLFQQSSP